MYAINKAVKGHVNIHPHLILSQFVQAEKKQITLRTHIYKQNYLSLSKSVTEFVKLTSFVMRGSYFEDTLTGLYCMLESKPILKKPINITLYSC